MIEKYSIKDVAGFLGSYGWKYDQPNDHELIVRFTGTNTETEFQLIIGVSESWIGLTIWPYLFPFPPDKEIEALKEICRTNFDIKLARLAMKSTGEITLCVDLSINGLTESYFHFALDILSYYADILYPIFLKYWEKE